MQIYYTYYRTKSVRSDEELLVQFRPASGTICGASQVRVQGNDYFCSLMKKNDLTGRAVDPHDVALRHGATVVFVKKKKNRMYEKNHPKDDRCTFRR